MSYPRDTDPLTDRPLEADELRRLNLEQDRAGGTMWPWIVGIIAVIVVVMLVYGYERPISTTAALRLLRVRRQPRAQRRQPLRR